MFSKEIKIGIKKAHGIKAKVFSEMLTVMAPTVNWRLGASSEQAHPLGRGCHGMPMTPMPVSVGSLSSSRSRLFLFVLLGENTPTVHCSGGKALEVPCLYLVQKDFSKKTQLTEATMILRMRCPFLLPSRSLTPLNLFPKKIQTKYRPDKI